MSDEESAVRQERAYVLDYLREMANGLEPLRSAEARAKREILYTVADAIERNRHVIIGSLRSTSAKNGDP